MEAVFYIVLLLDSKYKQHDGKVFKSISDAREFIKEYRQEQTADTFIIGSFTYNNSSDMNIHLIETLGFKGDKKNFSQLNIFENYSHEKNLRP